MKRVKSGGGWPAIRYSLNKAREVGGWLPMWRAMRSKNTCKTCALGMGGQRGGMVNEQGAFPEVCKKSLQAMAADMQPAIPTTFWYETSLDRLRAMSPRQLEACGRLVSPLRVRRGETHYQPITWEEAFDGLATRLRDTPPDRSFWYFSGRSSNEAGFLLQLFARLYGTNNVNNCSYYCHQASGVGLTSSIGTGTATIVLDDLELADLVFLIGGNPASNHPRLMTSLKSIRRRGGDVIVINPVRETGLVRFRIPSDPWSLFFGTQIATQYVQPHIGGDLALLAGIAKQVDQLGRTDDHFLSEHCRDADDWRDYLQALHWDEIEQKSGVSRDEIEQIAERYVRANNVVFAWTMGITHHAHGVQNVQAIANLALMRGMVGKPNAGLLPIRGHSNVQGIGSVGVTPQLKQAIFEQLQAEGFALPDQPGLDTLGCMEAAERGEMQVGVCLGGNLYGSNPDAIFADRALRRLESLVHLSTTLNTGHTHGLAEEVIVLPVLARDEEPQATTQESMFNFVRYSDGGPRRHEGPRSEVEIISDLAHQVLDTSDAIDWRAMADTGTIRSLIARTVPGFEKMETAELGREEFQIGGRTLHSPRFPIDGQRAVLHRHSLPDLKGTGDGELRLMTVRSEGQFNTVVYEEEDIYRGQERRDVVLMHSDDLQRLGLADDEPVRVESDTGSMEPIRVRRFDAIRAGNVLMYYPEANVLVSRYVDPQSRTPAFKGVVVRVVPLGS